MNELTLKDEAVRIDSEIQMWASTMGTAVYNIGKCMAAMKERQLYKELGYESFEEYCEQKYKLKRSQAAKYISVYQNLDENYILENQGAGIQKLYMLSQISEEDRESISEAPEELSVKELQAEIDRLREEREGIQMQLFDMQEKEKTAEEKIQEEVEKRVNELLEEKVQEETLSASSRINELQKKLEESEKKYESEKKTFNEQAGKYSILRTTKEELEIQAEQLKAKIKELENRPQDVAVAEPSEEEVKRKAEELAKEEIDAVKQQAETVKALKDAAIEDLKEQLKAKEAEAENIRAGYEKKLQNMSGAEKASSTQMENVPEDEKAKMKRLIGAVIAASNECIEAANLSEDAEMWLEKLQGIFGKITEQLKGTAL